MPLIAPVPVHCFSITFKEFPTNITICHLITHLYSHKITVYCIGMLCIMRSSTYFRNTKIFGQTAGRANEMTADEVIMRLKDRMSQHSQQFRQAFLSFDRRGKGLVSKKDFRQVGWHMIQNTRRIDIWIFERFFFCHLSIILKVVGTY